ncbi:MAG TPA: hypothetical protein VHG53_05320 [Candidatus Limnocylindria bacterium]|nr:hypothetical protein [Candidatus Limnocylindria bacterium]
MDPPVTIVRREPVARARERRSPFTQTDPAEGVRLVESLGGTAPEEWARTFGGAARAHERRAGEAVAGDEPGERRETALAYGYRRVAR